MKHRMQVFSLSIILFLIWLMLIRLGKERASVIELVIASGIYFVSCLPLLIYFARSETNIPYLPIFGFFYFTYFGISIFNKYQLFELAFLTPEIVTRCLNLVLFGFISLMVAFYTPLGKIFNLLLHPLKIPWDPHKAYRIGLFMGFLGIIVRYLTIAQRSAIIFSGVTNFIAGLSRLGIAVLFMLQLQNRLKFGSKLILWIGLFIPRVVLDLISGATFPFIVNFMILFFIHLCYKKSIPWLKFIIVGVIFFLIFSVRDRYREAIWYSGEYANTSPMQKIALYSKLISERLSGEKEEFQRTYEALSARTDSLVTLARVVQLTPAYIPFWNGYTYRTLLTTFMPRFILPEKSRKALGQEFGHRYMFLDEQDLTTSYNLPMLVEMYINFGDWGVIIGMFILGLIFHIFYLLFNHPDAGEGGIIISAMIFINLLNIESDFSLVFGNIIQYIILFYIIAKRMQLPVRRIETTGS